MRKKELIQKNGCRQIINIISEHTQVPLSGQGGSEKGRGEKCKLILKLGFFGGFVYCYCYCLGMGGGQNN